MAGEIDIVSTGTMQWYCPKCWEINVAETCYSPCTLCGHKIPRTPETDDHTPDTEE